MSETEIEIDEQIDEQIDGGDELGAPSLSAAIEALLLLADEPMSLMDLAAATRQPVDEVESVIRALSAEYTEQQRGFDLREVAGGWRYYSRAECSPVVERFVLDGQQARMTQASLETLAVIAYRQPIARGRVSAVRGSTSTASSAPCCPAVSSRRQASTGSPARTCIARPRTSSSAWASPPLTISRRSRSTFPTCPTWTTCSTRLRPANEELSWLTTKSS